MMDEIIIDQEPKKICVITGGGSGMGLATARIMGKDHIVILVSRTLSKLESAAFELRKEGIEAYPFDCDIADRKAVKELAAYAKFLGEVKAVIHAAGMSPHMGDPEKIMTTNALGTININEAFYEVMESGSCIIDVSSMASYMVPKIIYPTRAYKFSRSDQALFIKKMMSRVNLFPQNSRAYLAYAISKNFIIWYARTDAEKFGRKGIRVLSVSPGFFDTPMGDLEKDLSDGYIPFSALKRTGNVEEIANLFAFCVNEKLGYLTGTDILCDGGCIASGVNPLQQMRNSNQAA